MAERSRGRRTPLLATVLVVLMLLPLVSAAGGGMTMSATSLVRDGHGQTGPGDVNISVDVGSDVAAVGHLHVLLSASDGTVLFDENRSISRFIGEVTTEQFNILAVPEGQHDLSLTLWGDTGAASGDDVVVISSVIRRLAPADPMFDGVGAQSWDLTALDGGSLTPSSNESLRDGDHAQLLVPLTNAGDENWTGEVLWRVDAGNWTTIEVNLSGGDDHSLPVTFGPLFEGTSNFEVEITGTFHSASRALQIGPPPLAGLTLSATPTVVEPELGMSVEWSLNLSNDGEVAWNGTVSCTDPADMSVYNQSVEIESDSSAIWDVTFPVRPGSFDCLFATSARVHDWSVGAFAHAYEMDAGHMVAAASGGVAIDGGPFHVGDAIPLSLLVNNAGDLRGTAALQARITTAVDSTGWVMGQMRDLEVGSSRALTHTFTPQVDGDHFIEWRLVSSDALVDANLSGTTRVMVAPSQSLAIDLGSHTWSLEEGLSTSLELELGEGPLREVTLEVGYTDVDGEHVLLDTDLMLTPGRRTLTHSLGHPGDGASGVELFARLTPVGWQAAGDALFSTGLVAPAPVQVVHIESPEPAAPKAGQNVNMRFSLSNTGDAATTAGNLALIDTRTNAIVWEGEAPVVAPGATEEVRTQIVWPKGATVDLRLEWRTGEDVSQDVRSFASTTESAQQSGFEFDTMALVYGILVGFAIALVTRVVTHARAGQPLMKKRERKPRATTKASGEEKVEVACPTCDQRLRVPATYTGKARCPSCSTQFPVEAQSAPVEDDVPPVTAEDDEDEPEPAAEPAPDEDLDHAVEAVAQEPLALSRTDVLSCPECSQKLKVPVDRRPCKARCKGCSTIFRAEYG